MMPLLRDRREFVPSKIRARVRYSALMQIFLNGEPKECPSGSLAQLISQLGMKDDRVAVELNREIVPRAHWSDTELSDGDRLEIVHFVGGGR